MTDFGFNLPPNTASIDGFLVEVKAMTDTGCSPLIQLHAPALVGDTRSLAATPVSAVCSASEFRSAGGATDTWGTTLTVDDINHFSFGVRVNRCGSIGVDAVRMTVFYTPGPDVCGDPARARAPSTRRVSRRASIGGSNAARARSSMAPTA